MPIRFFCPECRGLLGVSSRKVGMRVHCPKCQAEITVPSESQAHEAVVTAPARAARPSTSPGGNAIDIGTFDELVEIFDATPAERKTAPVRAAVAAPVDSSLLLIPRLALYAQAAVIAVVAIGGFAAGYWIGGAKRPGVEALAPPVKRQASPLSVAISDQVPGNKIQPDVGAVLIVLPADKFPEPADRFATDNLRPADSPPSSAQDAVQAIETFGGAYARADERGQIHVNLPPGIYRVLVLSHQSLRPRGTAAAKEDVASLARFFGQPADLLGNTKYRWSLEELVPDHELTVQFGLTGQ